ncbi:hypothetical protein NONI108955_44655 [Nocardia ninae]|uniref:Uncharacterized protein n=1 Tax=Nocardia ninae NBRC 108245 TaxID=1210091 RepID=A0A511MF06_9NOCA|nr:hypothetical protein [Nocardia ninae]GEM39159.1 hypothetical protein NN4_36780 [Nocardia ninae NBRC 108245]
MNPIGPLGAADEGFNHQIVDTVATVGTSDLAWTEKVCAMACAPDGSVQLGFGLGQYKNRNVLDGYAGISRGVEQVTVRGSRTLAPTPEELSVGPIEYEIVEPLRKIRFRLAENDCQPVAFDWLFEAALPAQLEDRTHLRRGYRVMSDLVRYHQIGTASGWVSIDGQRSTFADWVSTRDHSWGVRYDVGVPLGDVESMELPPEVSFRMIWAPILMTRADGSRYGLHLHYQIVQMDGFFSKTVMGGVEHADGRFEKWKDLVPELSYDPDNRRLRGGLIRAITEDGTERVLTLETLSDTGFHLGAGLYFGFEGRHHGSWLGPGLHVDGERIEDCATYESARRLHQIRDTVVRVIDSTGATGVGNCQPIITGGDESLGLTKESSFM